MIEVKLAAAVAAWMVVLPVAKLVTRPWLLTVAAEGFEDVQTAAAETSCVLLSLNVPVAVNCLFRYAISGLMPVGRLDEAVAELETVLDLDPLNLEARRWLGLMHWWRRDYDRAVEQARLVLAVDSNYPTAHVLIGVTRCAERKFDEAIPALRKGVELSNGAPVASLQPMRTGGARMGRLSKVGLLVGKGRPADNAPRARTIVRTGLPGILPASLSP